MSAVVRRHIFFLLGIFFLPTRILAQTQPALHQPLDSLLLQGIDLIMQQKYPDALQHFREVSLQYPDAPEGALFEAAALQTAAIDHRDFRQKEQFDSLLHIARSLAEKMIDSQPSSPWGHYCLGTALGMESYDKIQRGEYISGYFKGRSAVSELERTLKMDSTFYDAYSVLGTYYYWKSRKTEILNWLPFFRDDRAKGMEYLRLGTEKGRYHRYAAMSNLLWIYLDASDVLHAEELARVALQKYPTHRIFLQGLAGALNNQNRLIEALDAYERQLSAIVADSAPNDYNEIGCRMNIVSVKISLQDTTRIREHLSVVLSKEQKPIPSFLRSKVEEKFQQARRFQEQLSSGGISSH